MSSKQREAARLMACRIAWLIFQTSEWKGAIGSTASRLTIEDEVYTTLLALVGLDGEGAGEDGPALRSDYLRAIRERDEARADLATERYTINLKHIAYRERAERAEAALERMRGLSDNYRILATCAVSNENIFEHFANLIDKALSTE